MDENGHMFIDNAPVVLFIKILGTKFTNCKTIPKGPKYEKIPYFGEL